MQNKKTFGKVRWEYDVILGLRHIEFESPKKDTIVNSKKRRR